MEKTIYTLRHRNYSGENNDENGEPYEINIESLDIWEMASMWNE